MSALDNITRNAICGKDQVDVQFHVAQDQLTICVNDNGDGVPEDELDSIFRPFYRVSTARDRNSGGRSRVNPLLKVRFANTAEPSQPVAAHWADYGWRLRRYPAGVIHRSQLIMIAIIIASKSSN